MREKIFIVLLILTSQLTVWSQDQVSSVDEKLFNQIFKAIQKNLEKNYDTTYNAGYQYVEYSYDSENRNKLLAAVNVNGVFQNFQTIGYRATRSTLMKNGYIFGKDSTRMHEPLLMFQGTKLTDFSLSSIASHFNQKENQQLNAKERIYMGFKRDTVSQYKVVDSDKEYYLIARRFYVKISGPTNGLKHPKSIDQIVFYKVNKQNMAVEELIKQEITISIDGIVNKKGAYERYEKNGSKYVVAEAGYTHPRYFKDQYKRIVRSGRSGLVKCLMSPIAADSLSAETNGLKNIDNLQPDLKNIKYHNFDLFCDSKPLKSFEKNVFIADETKINQLIHKYDNLLVMEN